MRNLLDHTPAQLRDWFAEQGLPAFRVGQVRKWIFEKRAAAFDEMTDLPAALRKQLADEWQIWTTKIVANRRADDGSEKLLLELADSQRIECVLLRDDRGHHAACISSQVGCAMGCAFCATGLEGFVRNLTRGEIVEQLLHLQRLLKKGISPIIGDGQGQQGATAGRVPSGCVSARGTSRESLGGVRLPSPPAPLPQAGEGRKMPSPPAPLPQAGEGRKMPSPPAPLPQAGEGRKMPSPPAPLPQAGEGSVLRLSHVVVMGMGEPLLNLDAVLPALEEATARDGLGISVRRITISTVGIPEGIRRLAREQCPYHLAVSLHAADDELRNELVPANRGFGIAAILAAADEFFEKTGRRVTYEYVLLAGINDRPEDARQLVKLLRGRPALVNLIPYNPVPELPYRRPTPGVAARFAAALIDGGLNANIRHRKGDRISAACGQLRRGGETRI